MTKQELIEYYGSQEKVADALGIKQPSVAGWPGDYVPIGRQYQVEVLTKGALKADPLPRQA